MTDEMPDATYAPDLPQTGWTTETPWCQALQMNKEEFISLLERFRVPHVLFGRSMLIDVSKFYQHMSASLEKALSQPARPIVQRRPGNAPGNEKFPSDEPGSAILTKRQVAELLQCSSSRFQSDCSEVTLTTQNTNVFDTKGTISLLNNTHSFLKRTARNDTTYASA